MESTVYLLTFNSETLFASKNITVLWNTMSIRCATEHRDQPEPYHTVRRRILAEGKYTHEPQPGWRYQIIERQLLRKPVQRKLDLFATNNKTLQDGGR